MREALQQEPSGNSDDGILFCCVKLAQMSDSVVSIFGYILDKIFFIPITIFISDFTIQ